MKKIYLGADHGGFNLKEYIKIVLCELKIPFEDKGAFIKEMDDFPVFAEKVCINVRDKESKGILICTTGIGMSIAANKMRGIRAALVDNVSFTEMARKHNDANVLVLSGKTLKSRIKPILLAFFNTKPSRAKRYKERNKQIEKLR